VRSHGNHKETHLPLFMAKVLRSALASTAVKKEDILHYLVRSHFRLIQKAPGIKILNLTIR
jgi:hypothetical protein